MAMLFFIVALAAILVSLSGYERTSLCSQEARTVSLTLAQSINEIINSPLEDERRVIKLKSTVSVGNGISGRYNITISRRTTSDPALSELGIDVLSESGQCSAGISLKYPAALDTASPKRLVLMPGAGATGRSGASATGRVREWITLKPSAYKPGDPRSQFLGLVKCTQKSVAGGARGPYYIFIQDCTDPDSDKCVSLGVGETAAGRDDGNCGFNRVAP